MILTLTPNPSLDRTVTLDGALVRGGVNRLGSVTTEPGGKGLNVARVLAAAGERVTALLPTGTKDPYLHAVLCVPELSDTPDDAARPALGVHPVPVAGSVRVNTAVTEPDGTTTKLNEPGARLSAAEVAGLEEALLSQARQAAASAEPAAAAPEHPTPGEPDAPAQAAASSREPGATWVVLSGSLPPGAPTDWYARLTARLHHQVPGVRVVVDTSDAPLAALMEAAAADPDCAPELIKPNGEELGQLAGLPAERAMALEEGAGRGELAPVVAAARTLVERGITEVLATLGPAGAVLVSAEGAWHATAPDVPVVSTVGAGDSSVAGYLLGAVRGQDAAGRLVSAMAHGSAAASLPGTCLPTPDDLPAEPAVVTQLA